MHRLRHDVRLLVQQAFNVHCPVVLRISGPGEMLLEEGNLSHNVDAQTTTNSRSYFPHFVSFLTSPLFSPSHYFIPWLWDAFTGTVESRDYQLVGSVQEPLIPSRDLKSVASIFFVPRTEMTSFGFVIYISFCLIIGAVNGFSLALWHHAFPFRIEQILWRLSSWLTIIPFSCSCIFVFVSKLKRSKSPIISQSNYF